MKLSNKLTIYLLIGFLFLLCSCTKSSAKKLLEDAIEKKEMANYREALIILDSLDNQFPEALQERKKALLIRKSIYSLQSDEKINTIPLKIDSLSAIIEEIKTSVYLSSDKREYIMKEKHLHQIPSLNQYQLFLKCDTLGFPSFELFYYGKSRLNIKAIALATKDSTIVSRQIEERDNLLKYHSIIDGNHYEVITIPPNSSRELILFIQQIPLSQKVSLQLLSNSNQIKKEQIISPFHLKKLQEMSKLSKALYERNSLQKELKRRIRLQRKYN